MTFKSNDTVALQGWFPLLLNHERVMLDDFLICRGFIAMLTWLGACKAFTASARAWRHDRHGSQIIFIPLLINRLMAPLAVAVVTAR
jgi:hypothetical protein